MASERVQRRIDLLLDEADEGIAKGDWAVVRDCSQKVLALDPHNQDATTFLAAAERALGDPSATRIPQDTPPESAPSPSLGQPTSFANGRYQIKQLMGQGGQPSGLQGTT